jgi:hypothetical protein
MDSGWLGNIWAIRGAWVLQREFGWAFLYPDALANWFWFANEGWPATGCFNHYRAD